MDCFDDIYATLLGEILSEYAVPWVENAFAPGSVCDAVFTRITEARQRIYDRQSSQGKDPDMEIIFDGFLDIQYELCRKMFQYGVQYAKRTPSE